MGNLEYKVVRKKKVDKELTVQVLVNYAAERILVEFSSKDGKMILQKSFQDTFYGKEEAKQFENSLKSFDEFKARLTRKL